MYIEITNYLQYFTSTIEIKDDFYHKQKQVYIPLFFSFKENHRWQIKMLCHSCNNCFTLITKTYKELSISKTS